MSEELKGCPFCGGSKISISFSEICCPIEWSAIALCSNCGCETEGSGVCSDKEDAKQEAIEAWNTRHIPEGFALVPIKPTYEMRKASTYWNDMYLGGHESPEEFNVEIYHAMITAYQEGK